MEYTDLSDNIRQWLRGREETTAQHHGAGLPEVGMGVVSVKVVRGDSLRS